jgi:hypothetical protein
MTSAKRVSAFVGTVFLALGGAAAAQSPDGCNRNCTEWRTFARALLMGS